MKRSRLLALGLDAGDYRLLQKWMDSGDLPNLSALRGSGVFGPLKGFEHHQAETPWTAFATGCLPTKTGYWATVVYDPHSYRVREEGGYDFKNYAPFYALGDAWRVAVFDQPHTAFSSKVRGVQALGWGAHSALTESRSIPEGVLPDLMRRHGEHPAMKKDHGCWWDKAHFEPLFQKFMDGIDRRVSIFKDLWAREEWDLFLTTFSETHSAGHDFFFLSDPEHPLYPHREELCGKRDLLLEVYKKIDSAVGQMLSVVSKDVRVALFSPHGMTRNNNDISSGVFLPELLYRRQFPQKCLFERGSTEEAPGLLCLHPTARTWTLETWKYWRKNSFGKRFFEKFLPQRAARKIHEILAPGGRNTFYVPFKQLGSLAWQPTAWYRPYWPKMRAFALPSYADGYIRINLKGREVRGTVEPEDYLAECEALTAYLEKSRCGRTGKPLVRTIIRPRRDGLDLDPNLPPADLIVLWQDTVTDVLDHPGAGRIGPVPLSRPGGHRSTGFLLASGPDIPPGTSFDGPRSIDLAPTFLDWLGAEIPFYMEGRPIRFAS